MSDHVIDTVALVRYLDDSLPKAANRVFESAEAGHGSLFLPQIAMGEFVYLALRGKLGGRLSSTDVQEQVQALLGSEFVVVSQFPTAAWDHFLRSPVRDLHDRLIASEALARGLPVVSNDPSFGLSPGPKAIW